MNNLLFGYGTLRSDIDGGRGTPKYLKSLGFGEIDFALYRIRNRFGTWAGVKRDEQEITLGEVFEIKNKIGELTTAFGKLDWREQTEAVTEKPCYFREVVSVKMKSGEVVEAWVYFAHPDNTKFLKKIENGDWKKEIYNERYK